MEKPYCSLCKEKHYPRDGHIWKEEKIASVPNKEVVQVTNCLVCEERKRKAREKMKAWRASK